MNIRPYNPVNKEAISSEIGFMPKVGELVIGNSVITSDLELPGLSIAFRIGDAIGAKTIILEGADGQPVVFPNVITGELIVFPTTKIIYQATVLSELHTTDVLYVTWLGGQ